MEDQRLRKKPRILLSNFTSEERKQLSEKIRCIGGIIYECSCFTPLATHIVCKLPSRNEKFICACASGKWILPATYIEESYKKNQWLDEKPYEWSTENCPERSPVKDLFLLPKKWREKFETQRGAFNKWNVVLVFKDQKRKNGFKRLIDAGNGRVLNLRPPFRGTDIKMIKFAICEDMQSKELLPYKRACVPIINSEAIIDYILKGTKPTGTVKNPTTNKKFIFTTEDSKVNRQNGKADLKNKSDQNWDKGKRRKVQVTLKQLFVELKNGGCFSEGGLSENGKINKADSGAGKSTKSINCLGKKSESNDRENTKTGSSFSKHRDTIDVRDRLSRRCKTESFNEKEGSSTPNSEQYKFFDNCSSDSINRHENGRNWMLEKENSSFTVADTDEATHDSKEGSLKFNASNVPKEAKEIKTDIFDEKTPSFTARGHLPLQPDVPSPLVDLPGSLVNTIKVSKQGLLNSCKANNVNLLAASRKSSKFLLEKKLVKDAEVLCSNLGPKRRSTRVKRDAEVCIKNESPPKKLKMSTNDIMLQGSDVGYTTCFDPSAILSQKRIPLHANGADLIEGCLEESLYPTAVKMMATYLSPTVYLPARMISVLMGLLKSPTADLNVSLTFCVRSLLNRCISLHPPQTVLGLYQEAFKISAAETKEGSEIDGPFDYVIATFREALCVMKENGGCIRKQAMFGLVNFITSVFETDSNFHWNLFQSDTSSVPSNAKPVLNDIIGHKTEQIANGPNVKTLLRFAVELAIESVNNSSLVPLRRLAFLVVRLVGQSCQMSDMIRLSTIYGPSCTDLTSEMYQTISDMTSSRADQHNVLSVIFASLRLGWLSSRLADLFICSYDISNLSGKARELLRKPLSLDKIVSCYFHLIPTFSKDLNDKNSHVTRTIACKQLTVIGNRSAMSANKTTEAKKTAFIKRNLKGETQLHIACIKNKPDDVKRLLLLGIDPNTKDNAGWTALHEASNHGHDSCVAELLKCRGLDVFATGMNGYSALHDAVENNRFEVVKLLTKSGGLKLLEMKTLTGSTAYDLAATSPMRDLINELGCDLLCDQSTPETYSSFHGVTAEEVNQFLALLVVLLQHFVPLHKTSCEMDSLDKTDGLRNLVGQLQQRHTGKSKLLLNVINRILS